MTSGKSLNLPGDDSIVQILLKDRTESNELKAHSIKAQYDNIPESSRKKQICVLCIFFSKAKRYEKY